MTTKKSLLERALADPGPADEHDGRAWFRLDPDDDGAPRIYGLSRPADPGLDSSRLDDEPPAPAGGSLLDEDGAPLCRVDPALYPVERWDSAPSETDRQALSAIRARVEDWSPRRQLATKS